MTAPIRHTRRPETLAAIERRNLLIAEAAARYFPGASANESGRRLHAALARKLDLLATLPAHEEVRAALNVKTEIANRIAALMRPAAEGGFSLDASAMQVTSERRKLERAEAESKRITELKEVRTVRLTATARLDQNATDWVLRGGIPANCVLEPVDDQPISELMVKADGGRIDAAVERCRLRLRELAADLHRVRSSPWPSSLAKAAARALIDRLADAGAPILDGAIEHGQDISFATKRLTAMVHNVPNAPGAVAYPEADHAIGLICWLFRDQMIAKINAGFDEIAEDKIALSAAQREEMEAEINQSALMIERNECSLIWAADAKGEVIDFRNDTTPMALLGLRLVHQPRASNGPSSPERAGYSLIGGR